MKILITGATGFVGSHLVEYCLGKGDEVFGTVIGPNASLDNLSKEVRGKITLVECEMTDYRNVLDMIKTVKPDVIFHLAAQSFVPTSWKSPADTLMNNVTAQINLFEAVLETKQDPVIQIACSSEEYGFVSPNEVPITEDNALRPLSPYAVSKVTQGKLGYQYHANYGLRIVVTRGFNHTGPRRGLQFVCPSFAKQVIDAEDGEVIKVGNLEARRDFTDVRDMVKAYYMAVTNPRIKFGEPYNICTGKSIRIGDILNEFIEISGKTLWIKEDPSKMRPSDVPVLEGDPTKFKEATGWEPEIDLETTLKDIYKHLENDRHSN